MEFNWIVHCPWLFENKINIDLYLYVQYSDRFFSHFVFCHQRNLKMFSHPYKWILFNGVVTAEQHNGWMVLDVWSPIGKSIFRIASDPLAYNGFFCTSTEMWKKASFAFVVVILWIFWCPIFKGGKAHLQTNYKIEFHFLIKVHKKVRCFLLTRNYPILVSSFPFCQYEVHFLHGIW